MVYAVLALVASSGWVAAWFAARELAKARKQLSEGAVNLMEARQWKDYAAKLTAVIAKRDKEIEEYAEHLSPTSIGQLVLARLRRPLPRPPA